MTAALLPKMEYLHTILAQYHCGLSSTFTRTGPDLCSVLVDIIRPVPSNRAILATTFEPVSDLHDYS